MIDTSMLPKKCNKCGGEELKQANQDKCGNWVLEYDLVCNKCGNTLGHWGYGEWTPKNDTEEGNVQDYEQEEDNIK